MDKISFSVVIPQSVALAAGKTEYGETRYSPTEEELSSISPEERAWLDVNVRSAQNTYPAPLRLDQPQATWDAIMTGVRTRMAAEAAEQARRAAEHDAAVAALLALPDDEWVGNWSLSDRAQRNFVSRVREMDGDSRIAARMAALRPLLAAVRAVDDEAARARADADAAERRVKANAEADAKAERDAAHAALRAWATTIPDLARAATDGYEIRGAVMDRIADAFVDAAGPPYSTTTTLREGANEYDRTSWEDRSAPSRQAFVRLDAVTAAAAAVAKPECVEIEVRRVQRVTVQRADRDDCDDRDHERYTGIVAIVHTPLGIAKDRVVIWRVD